MKSFRLITSIFITSLVLFLTCGLTACGGDSSDEETLFDNSNGQNSYVKSSSVDLTIMQRSSSSVKLAYMLLSGQDPSMVGARIIVWTGLVANNSNIVKDVALSGSSSAGEITISGLTPDTTDYVFGIVTSSNTAAPLATLTLPHAQTSWTVSTTHIDIIYAAANTLIVDYSVADGVLPHTSGLSISFWNRDTSTIYFGAPVATIPIPTDATSGTVAIPNLSLLQGTTYSVGVMVSSKYSDVATTTTFTTNNY